MKQNLKRPIGIFLIVAACSGILLSGVGIYHIWRIKSTTEANLLETLNLASETLKITSDALTTAETSLDTIKENTNGLHNTILTVAQSINDAIPVVETLAALMQEDLPTMLEATQTSLETAQASAKLIDSVMTAVTSIPFYPGEPYDPEVPLHIALQNVAASIEDLPETLSDVGDDLETNSENLSQTEDDIISLAITVNDIGSNIEEARNVIAQYKIVIATMQSQVESTQTRIPGVSGSIAWSLTILIIWLAFAQVGLLIQGLTLVEEGQVA